MLLRGLIIEGVSCAGKSTLLRALLSHPSYLRRGGQSAVVLTEHHTQRVLEGAGLRRTLSVADNVNLLRSHVTYLAGLAGRLKAMRRWVDEDLPNPQLSAVLERFHLTHVLHYQHMAWADVSALDDELAELGFRHCLVVASAAELERRLSVERGARWGGYLVQDGVRGRLQGEPSVEAKAQYFVRQQDALRHLARCSRLPAVEIDTSDAPLESSVQTLIRLLLDPLR